MKAPMARLRLRLTAWYVTVFIVITTLFGGAVYSVLNRQMMAGIDASLGRTVDQRTRWVLARGSSPSITARDSALWERKVMVFDENGDPFQPGQADPLFAKVAEQALRDSIAKTVVRTPDGRRWVLYGKRFLTNRGNTYATVAAADYVELRNRYPSIFTGFITSAIIAVLLVGISGAALAHLSIKPVESAFDQMRRFMSDAAHELKTPIAILRARADVALQRARTEADYREVIEGISAEAARLGGLVENMLLLARADTGQWPVRQEKIFLDDVLLDAASAARSLAAAKDVEVEIAELHETQVRGDPTLLRQLFMILLDNAVHFTPAGGRVTASATRAGKSCTVVISDTGVGIPASAMPHVFDRFFRADSARGRGGAGLGLAIAGWIVDLHGGRIDLTSDEGEGTTVTVALRAL